MLREKFSLISFLNEIIDSLTFRNEVAFESLLKLNSLHKKGLVGQLEKLVASSLIATLTHFLRIKKKFPHEKPNRAGKQLSLHPSHLINLSLSLTTHTIDRPYALA